MVSSNESKAGMPVPKEMYALLGPPPLLSTESPERFNAIFDQLVACLKPQNLLELIHVRDFAIASWEAERYTRYRSMSFGRRFQRMNEEQIQRAKAQKARRQERLRNYAEQAGEYPHDISAAVALEQKVLESDEIEELSKRGPSEHDQYDAFEKAVTLHKDAEFLISSLSKRKNEALLMLNSYRKGLGKRAAEAVDEVVEGEFKEIEAPAKLEAADAPPFFPAE